MTDILAALLDACDRSPEAPAISFRRRTLRCRDLRDLILGVSSSVTAAGLEPGDRVLFSVRPQLDGICLALGVIAAGGTIVFADPGAGESLFRARAALAAPRWVAAESLLYAASTRPLRRIARSRGLELPDYRSVVPDARHIVAGVWLPGVPKGALGLASLLRVGRRLGYPTKRSFVGAGVAESLSDSPSSSALIIFTSGTTDAPKAVVHSRSTLGAGLSDFAAAVGFVAGERVLTDQLMVGIPALISGAHWVVPPPGIDPGAKPSRYLGLLPDADVLFAVPAALDAMLRMLERKPRRTPKLRALLIGGAPVLRPLLERARAQLPGTAIRAVYGMTEILPVAIADGDEKLAFEGAGDFVGELMPSISARIVDGELEVSGAGLASYLGEAPFASLKTGDLARLDGRRVILSGRAKEMFIRGTTNVYPGLYESVIAGIRGVSEAALVGVPDEFGDDSIVLAVVLDGTTEAAVRRALPGLIDAAVLPDRIVVMKSLPKSGRSSKLDRPALAEAVLAEAARSGRAAKAER